MILKQLGLALVQIGVAGILVLDTKPDSPAKRAGIQGTRRDEYGRQAGYSSYGPFLAASMDPFSLPLALA